MDFKVFDLGLIGYQDALSFQKETLLKVRSGLLPSALILCSHNPVITKGRKALQENLLIPEDELQSLGVSLYDVERGGDITYHGPGQLLAYPIFDLAAHKKDIHLFLRNLEECGIAFLKELGIVSHRRHGLTGVWRGERKIASIGISVRNWITFHGLSINIKRNDLDNFRLIKPCGMDVKMACAEEVLGREIDMFPLKKIIADKFKEVFCPEKELACIR